MSNKDQEILLSELMAKGEAGDLAAQSRLGVMYHTGDVVMQDVQQAIYWFTKAAEQGHVVSKLFLGLLYSELSNKWYLDAAVQGSAAAQRIIGDSYYIPSASASERSHGLNAFRWYSLAAAQGDAEAQFNLGLMYYNGENVTPDVSKALELWASAAEQGLEVAKHTLETIVLDD